MRKLLLTLALAAGIATPALARHHPYAIERTQPVFDPATFAYPVTETRSIRRHHRSAVERHAPGRKRAARRRSGQPAPGAPRETNPAPAGSVESAVARAIIGNVAGMNRAFVEKLQEAFAAMPAGSSCSVGSGFRTYGEQARLYRSRPGLAARPGHSNHERGLAADLRCGRGGLAWMHRNARRYGLRFPMSYEAWHVEPVGLSTRRFAHHRRSHYASAR